MGPEPNTQSPTAPSPEMADAAPTTPPTVIRERKISNINTIKVWEDEQQQAHAHGHVHLEKHPHAHHLEKNGHAHAHGDDDLHKKPTTKIRKSAQILSAVAANMGAFALGTVMAWSATALPSLRASKDHTDLSDSEEAWIGSIVTLAAAVACPIAAYCMTTFGRRRSMLWLTIPCVAGWLAIAFSDLIPMPTICVIYIGRSVTGFCGGAYMVIAPIFISETSHSSLRGALASGFDLMLSAGMLFIYIIGAFTSWETQALACACVPLLIHGLLLMVSESPRYLVESGRVLEAGEAIAWLFGHKDAAVLASEVAGLQKAVEDSNSKPINFDRVILKLSVLKPILICITVMFFYTMCVYDAVIFYTVDIFKSTGTDMDPKECAIVLGVVQVVATIPATILVEKYGRRLLLLTSEFLLTASLLALGTYFYTHTPSYLPLLALTIFLVGYSVGIGPLSLVLISEVVPPHLKGSVTCGALVVRWLLGFAVTNLFETVEDAIGMPATYWIFGVVCAFGFGWVWFCVPETSGKSLDDIQYGFMSKKNKNLSLNNNCEKEKVEKK